MFDNDYLAKLRRYLGKDITMLDNNNETSIYGDSETMYFLRNNGQQYILIMKERGIETKLAIFQTEIEMKRKFSLWMKNIFGNGFEYPHIDKFEDIEDASLLKELMFQYSDKELYSVDEEKEDKIILKKNQNDFYNLFFMNKNGKKHIFEQDEAAPFVFERFYTEVVFYGEMLERIKGYELIFEERIEYDMKIELLGYE